VWFFTAFLFAFPFCGKNTYTLGMTWRQHQKKPNGPASNECRRSISPFICSLSSRRSSGNERRNAVAAVVRNHTVNLAPSWGNLAFLCSRFPLTAWLRTFSCCVELVFPGSSSPVRGSLLRRRRVGLVRQTWCLLRLAMADRAGNSGSRGTSGRPREVADSILEGVIFKLQEKRARRDGALWA
jgi:hypothetical protein